MNRRRADKRFTTLYAKPHRFLFEDAGGSSAPALLEKRVLLSLTIDNPVIVEGTGTGPVVRYTVTLSPASASQVKVDYFTSDITAQSVLDYVAGTGTLTFEPGETGKTIGVNLVGDALDENIESFAVNLLNPINTTIADNQGEAFIIDDDLPSALSIDDASIVEGNTGTRFLETSVRLSTPSGLTVTADFGTQDQSAAANEDYGTTAGVVTFAPGETVKPVRIPIFGDTISEADETFQVLLSNPVNASLADPVATLTITDDDTPVGMSIRDARVAEGDDGITAGNNGLTAMEFDVELSAASQKTVTASFKTAGLTATEGVDYVANAGKVSFAPGETRKTVTVDILGDTLPEDDEQFSVTLADAVNTTITDALGIGTIIDDDNAPIVEIGDATVFEGNSGVANLGFPVTLSRPSGQAVTVNFLTNNGTAVSGSDFTATTGVLTFAPGETLKTLNVPILGDALYGTDEYFTLDLSQALNARIGRSQGLGSILNDDMLPRLTVADINVNEGNEGLNNAELTLSLTGGRETAVTVDYLTADLTATAGLDYLTTAGTARFEPQESQVNLTVPIVGDFLREGNETFRLNLTQPRNAALDRNQATVTIVDNDTQPKVSVADAEIQEGDAGVSLATVLVTLDNASGETITVDLATQDGTATAGEDYVAVTTSLTFTPGVTQQSITIPVIGDVRDEPQETFRVTLTNALNAVIGRGAADVTIIDDDGLPALSVANASAFESDGTLTFTVRLSPSSGQTVTADYDVSDVTALAGLDYASVSGTLTFGPGTTSQTVAVPLINDEIPEGTETLTLTLSNPSGAKLDNSTATGVIYDDDSYTVTTTDDAGAGSLRAALEKANANPGTDLIDFAIPGSGPFVIALRSELPVITDPVIVDARTQPGAGGARPIVALDGSGAGAGVNGLTVRAGNSTIAGLVINNFTSAGILIEGRGGDRILGNWIGPDADGTRPQGNKGYGIVINNSPNHVVGGTVDGEGNVISGNALGGIYVGFAGASGNKILGNTIGRAPLDDAIMPNGNNGIFVDNAVNNIIGGVTAAERNRITGNEANGVHIYGIGGVRNRVQGNAIVRNRGFGILQTHIGRPGNVIPTAGPGRNLIENNGLGALSSPKGTRANRL